MKKYKNFPQFTHFISIPFIRQNQRQVIGSIQDSIQSIFKHNNLQKHLKRSNTNLMHITLSMLTLNLKQNRDKTQTVFKNVYEQVASLLKNQTVKIGQIKYFTKVNKFNKSKNVTLIYMEFEQNQALKKIQKLTDFLIRELIKLQIVVQSQLKSMHIQYDHKTGLFMNDQFHMTLFRLQNLTYDQKFQQMYTQIQQLRNSYKDEKLQFPCDFVDVSTRFHYDGSNFYQPLARIKLQTDK